MPEKQRIVRCSVVLSGMVSVGNVSQMLFQEGRSSNLWLSRDVGQVARTRNKLSDKCTEVYCMWIVWVTRRRGLRGQNSNPVCWSVRLHLTTSRARMRALVRRKYTRNQGRLLSGVLVAATRHPATRSTLTRAQFTLQWSVYKQYAETE